MSDPRTRIAALLLATVSALFIWWGWKQGAYFGGVFFPGALLVFLLLALLLVMAPFSGRLRGPAAVAFFALFGLATLTFLSAAWSPLPSTAVKDGQHVFIYLALFAIGLWATNLLGRRMLLALAPVAIAGAVVGIATVVVLATGDNVNWYLHGDVTLRFPIGYRNANAAFFIICLWPLLALATESDWRWELRALLLGAGTVLFELAFLAQSRGSVPAAALALLVYLALSRNRLRAAVLLALVVVPSLPALPTLLDVFQNGQTDPSVIPLLRDAAKAIAITSVLSVGLGALALGWVGPRLRLSEEATRSITRAVGIVAVLVTVLGGSLYVARHGGPGDFLDQRLDEFQQVGYPDLSGQGIRYGANVGSNRHDFWRVAADEGFDRPLLGGGAGSFQLAYLEHRRSDESPEDPHSLEALVFSELGLPGLLLLAAFVIAAAMAGLRVRRLGPIAAALVAGSLAAATQWLMQSSYDWLWNYPGVTAPAMFLLGAAVAPALLDPFAGQARRARLLGAAVLVALALLTVPLFLSGRYMQRANEQATANPQAAIADLDRAADLNPLDAEPLLAKGVVESRVGEYDLALDSFREAIEREPRNYAAYYFIASVQSSSDPAAARLALAKAKELNPGDRPIRALERRLDQAAGG